MPKISIALIIFVVSLFVVPACLAQETYPLGSELFDRLTDFSKEVVGHQISLSDREINSLDCQQSLYLQWLKQDNIRFSQSINALDDFLRIERFHGRKKQYNSTAIKVIKRFIAGLEREIDASVEYSDFNLAKLEKKAFLRRAAKEHNALHYRIRGLLNQISAELELIPDYEFIEKMEKMIKVLPETMGKVNPDLDSGAPQGALYWHKEGGEKKLYFSSEEELNNLIAR